MAGFFEGFSFAQIMEVENESQTEDELLVSKVDMFHFHDGGRKGSQE